MTTDKTPISSSPDRYKFQTLSTSKKLEEDPTNESALEILDWYEKLRLSQVAIVDDPEWQKDNMEYDLRSTLWILDKVRADDVYAQHLYAAMCNNDFIKNEVWPLLTEKKWFCSWRSAGGILANMCEEGDYIDWYCSGIQKTYADVDDEAYQSMSVKEQEDYLKSNAYVRESYVTDEIRDDLLKLGWIVIAENDSDK